LVCVRVVRGWAVLGRAGRDRLGPMFLGTVLHLTHETSLIIKTQGMWAGHAACRRAGSGQQAPLLGHQLSRASHAARRERRELVPAKRTPDETNENQTNIPFGFRLFVVWGSSDRRAPNARQTKASFVSSVSPRWWHVCGPNLERTGQALVSGLASGAGIAVGPVATVLTGLSGKKRLDAESCSRRR